MSADRSELIPNRGAPALAVIAILVILSAIAFAGSLNNKPVAEDFHDRTEDLLVNSAGQSRPAYAAVVMAVGAVTGAPWESPAAHRISNFVFHTLSIAAIFFIVRRLTSDAGTAAISALFFALYPRHHEAIMWPAAGLHPVMTMLLLFGFWSYLHFRQGARQRWFYGAVGLFALALLSNEGAISFVGILIAWEIVNLRFNPTANVAELRDVGHRAIRELRYVVPFIGIAAIYGISLLVLRSGVVTTTGSGEGASGYHLITGPELLTRFAGYITYTFLPFVNLRSLDSPVLKLGTLALVSLFILIALRFGNRLTLFGVLWILLTALPYTLFVPFGNADRYFYFIAVGLAIMGASLIVELKKMLDGRINVPVLRATAIVLVAVYVVASMWTLSVRDSEWEEAGERADRILEQVYERHPTTTVADHFVFLDLPNQHGQARVIGWGMHRALQEHYELEELPVISSHDPALINVVMSADSSAVPNPNVHVYIHEDGALLDLSFSYSEPEVRELVEEHFRIAGYAD